MGGPTTSTSGLIVEDIDADHAVGHSAQVFISLWRRETTLEAVAKLAHLMRTASHRGAMGILTVVEKDALLPTSEARAALARSLKSTRSAACAALVFEGDGFRAAAVRAITTTIYQLTKPPFPMRVFGDVAQAAAWMETLHENIQPENVVATAGELRAALDRH